MRALVASIPAGRVSTYGDIAEAAELSSPRIVAWIMRTDSSDLPWHRVIRASGRPAPHLTTEQLELLRAEGVLAAGRPDSVARGSRSTAFCAAREQTRKHPATRQRLSVPQLRVGQLVQLKDQAHQRGRPRQARERRGRRPWMQRVDSETEHQRAQQHLRPFRQRAPSLDEPVVGLTPRQRVDDHHPGRP